MVANGVDVAYPPGNARIFETLAARHLVVSELPPGSHPTRVRFLARNRLIAAMSGGTVVVEAALRSGARNTAGWAAALSRPLMAVPGPVHSAASVGPHLMVRSGQAVLVTRAAEVLELVSAAGEHLLPLEQGPRTADRRARPDPARGVRGAVGPAVADAGGAGDGRRRPGAGLPGGAVRARVARRWRPATRAAGGRPRRRGLSGPA